MRDITVHIVNAFVDAGEGGNPAGIVLDADELCEEDMQAIAAEVGLSETAFVSRSDAAAIRLDYFTPVRRVAQCGHATIATFWYLLQIGRMSVGSTSMETVDGIASIIVQREGIFMEQDHPVYESPGSWSADFTQCDVVEALGVAVDALMSDLQPLVVSTGDRSLLVPLRGSAELAKLRPDMGRIADLSEQLDLICFYPFATESLQDGRHATARMFAPAYGIDEEAATGMSAGALACYLRDRLSITDDPLLIEQGHFMSPPSPSVLIAHVFSEPEHGVQRVLVGGSGTLSKCRTLSI